MCVCVLFCFFVLPNLFWGPFVCLFVLFYSKFGGKKKLFWGQKFHTFRLCSAGPFVVSHKREIVGSFLKKKMKQNSKTILSFIALPKHGKIIILKIILIIKWIQEHINQKTLRIMCKEWNFWELLITVWCYVNGEGWEACKQTGGMGHKRTITVQGKRG